MVVDESFTLGSNRNHPEIVVISGVFSVVWVLRRMDLRGGTVHRVSATRVANAREKRV